MDQLFVPFNDLRPALGAQRDELLAIIAHVLDAGMLIQGPEHQAFEQELAQYIGATYALGVGNGTDALEIAFRALKDGDRRTIVTVANAGGFSTAAARAVGLDVRYCDVDPTTHCLDPDSLESCLNDSVLAVVITHLYGHTVDVKAITDICTLRGIRVVEDCAQSIGARTDQGAAGTFGDLATFSFYPVKNLGALGDGGAIVTSDEELASRVRELRQYGWSDRNVVSSRYGKNSRLDEIQAAVLRYRLPRVDAWNARRRQIVGAYEDASPASVRVLPARTQSHSAHLAVVETGDARDLADHLSRWRVGTSVHYPIPDHLQRVFSTYGDAVSLPVTERLVGRILSLPCFPEMTDQQIAQVCTGLQAYNPDAPSRTAHTQPTPGSHEVHA